MKGDDALVTTTSGEIISAYNNNYDTCSPVNRKIINIPATTATSLGRR